MPIFGKNWEEVVFFSPSLWGRGNIGAPGSRSATGPSTRPPIDLLQILQQSAPVPPADHGDSASVYGSPAGRLPGELVRIPYKLHNRERLQHLRPGIRL